MTTDPVKKSYNPTLDVLRLISILAVVMIHTTTKVFEITGNNLMQTPLTLFLNQTARFAVPLFFMISGFTLKLNYPDNANLWVYFKKRISRLLLPYVVWSGIYYFLIYRGNNQSFWHTLVYGGASYQLYFIPTILLFYLLFPLVNQFWKLFSNKYVVIMLGLTQMWILAEVYYGNQQFTYSPMTTAKFNFFPFLIGAVASYYEPQMEYWIKRLKNWLMVLTPILMLYVTYEGLSRFLATGNYLSFYSQWRPSILIYSMMFGLTVYYLCQKNNYNPVWLKTLSGLTSFVFFAHVMILEFLWQHLMHSIFPANWNWLIIFDLTFFGLVGILSFGLAGLCYRIPYFKKIL